MNSEIEWVAMGDRQWQQPETPAEMLANAGLSHQNTGVVLAQEQFDQDIVSDLGNAMAYFVESGQVWALLIGFVLGYMLRGVTTYR